MQPFTLQSTNAFELKGCLFTLTVLHLLNPDINAFTAQLRRNAQKTPGLFKNMPLIIDLQRLSHVATSIDFASIQQLLKQYGLIPVGIRHGNEQQNNEAQAAGLALIASQSASSSPTKTKSTTAEGKEVAPPTKVITKPIRSGQQVYARKSSLIILASVSHGAELLADGCIHVYGSLRGRALAGINGDKTARIFCHKLEAELVSIAGFYKLQENLPTIEANMTQVYLEEDQLKIAEVF